jgi:hypothetical protein
MEQAYRPLCEPVAAGETGRIDFTRTGWVPGDTG